MSFPACGGDTTQAGRENSADFPSGDTTVFYIYMTILNHYETEFWERQWFKLFLKIELASNSDWLDLLHSYPRREIRLRIRLSLRAVLVCEKTIPEGSSAHLLVSNNTGKHSIKYIPKVSSFLSQSSVFYVPCPILCRENITTIS